LRTAYPGPDTAGAACAIYSAIHLIGLRPLLRRVTIRAHSILLELDRTTALQTWQAAAGISNVRTLIAHARSRVGPGEELSEGENGSTFMLPVRARLRGGRTSAVTAHGAPLPSSHPDSHLLAALARAHRWKAQFAEGRFASVAALAIHAGQERRHVGRTLNLAFLAPDLAMAFLDGNSGRA
jgi:hypothetical protein